MEPKVALSFIVFIAFALLIKVGFVGMATWFSLASPRAAERIHAHYSSRPRRCLLVGAVNIIVTGFVIIACVNIPALAWLGFLLLAGLLVISVLGYGPAYQELGQRIPGGGGAFLVPTLRGGILAECAFITPIAGQLLSVYIWIRGVGAVVLTLLNRAGRSSDEDSEDSDEDDPIL